jgi:DNA modification methylase
LNGDVIACLRSLPDACVQCVVTSPPYWGLRDYGVEGQIGLEPTPEEHVEKMVEVFREVRRVLRDDGVMWLNYGDCYVHGTPGGGSPFDNGRNDGRESYDTDKARGREKLSTLAPGLKTKDLVGMPWRIAFALQADGWYLRSDIIWSKPNPMPESVTDRPTKSHEYVFLLAKQARYFYDADAVREAQNWVGGAGNRNYRAGSENGREAEGQSNRPNPAGRNRRTVWEIATQPMPDAHFATFPEALVEPCIKAGTSARGACPKCGAPWRRVVERLPVTGRNENKTPAAAHAAVKCSRAGESHVKTVGWEPSCGCETQDGEPVPCVVLDPFGGSGTVAKVARDLGRSSILIEINPEYVQIAKKRLRIGEQLDSGVCEYVVKNFRTEATP